MDQSKLIPGQRVEIIDGVLKGEKATIEIHPKTGSHIREAGWAIVWIRFDRDGMQLGTDQGRAILKPTWMDIGRLRSIVSAK